MIVAIFEDEKWENLLPMTLMHPAWELRCGISSLYEKIRSQMSCSRILLFTRDYLVPTLRSIDSPVNEPDKIDDEVLLLNGRLLLDSQASTQLKTIQPNTIGLKGDITVFAYVNEKIAKQISQELCAPLTRSFWKGLRSELKQTPSDWVKIIDYPWNLIEENLHMLLDEIPKEGKVEGTVEDSVRILGPLSQLTLLKGSVIEAGSIVDVREGPVWIGEDTEIQPLTHIQGPTYIGSGSIVYGAQIREGCSIGSVCRIGGEIEESIVHGFSNKRHLGFLGHSYIGEWVNIGAGSTNSDLKNTYGTVRMKVGVDRVDTGNQFVGCFIGDHAKIGINVAIMTGKKIGIFSHALGFIDDDIPPFTVWAKSLGKGTSELLLDSAIEIQKRVFKRRKREQAETDVELLEHLFYMTAKERERSGVTKAPFEVA